MPTTVLKIASMNSPSALLPQKRRDAKPRIQKPLGRYFVPKPDMQRQIRPGEDNWQISLGSFYAWNNIP
jgi:hypothetical protein